MLRSFIIAIDDTPSLVVSAVGATIPDRRTVILRGVTGSDTIYIGGSDVDATDGFPVAATDALSLDLGPGDSLYAVCAENESGSLNVIVARAD